MKNLHKIAFGLLILGGLLALLNALNIYFAFLPSTFWRGLGILIGAAAIYEIVTHTHRCRECISGKSQESSAQASPPQEEA
ncbi:MAG: hypothetical protein A3C80_03280 [Candidatus Ryanbacteria bacterium RIFCSPHIGHO2_02_FULL_45_43]|uniref:Uncharacterized protein n=1 Tax=Candidatus Ryanbacteria bacterium RIFCSPHIGHO2_01_45_13 TaxID=1802112 RepID=A0A1G2FU51_9BACT|nr:MAG: hypothetical protein A2W41_01220 [Candidatus Ryanbacteria bacterium RIFCSPHIGHO2_01_45_13]OGZ41487.1 MAG: hypothetical protein A2718_03545 [Candidatus Ryanbacteria bacterium RIFCSPHIGHO2_01_FULL_44_130]OGZ47954.1 MAG: hypothetical protein A3C80_03280 [Candidatus Ryanbacteria bacterium RIFCSPHIGHO2_02_FULL_45_43]OGZ50090.1 MAG: hypothetical protein A3E55_01145 [Candidatus Ryanbacteria bacterium RIFCSPHIGHO2_12_FULL_44_20]OGZ51092.1 MAG: hypothetical protein A3A17_03585 [Candidatus Ryanba